MRYIRKFLNRFLPIILALSALYALLSLNNVWLGVALCGIALLFAWRKKKWLSHRPARLLIGVFSLLATTYPESLNGSKHTVALLSGLILLSIISQERLFLTRIKVPKNRSANLGINDPSWYRFVNARLVAVPDAILLVLYMMSSVSGILIYSYFALCLILLIFYLFFGYVCRRVGQKKRNRYSTDPVLRAALDDYSPVFALYLSAPANTAFHLSMWLPYFNKLGDRFVVIVREKQLMHTLSVQTNHPVIYARTMAQLEDLIVPSLRAVFYANNAMRNSHLVRLYFLRHVQLLHGDSDKVPSYNPVTQMFDLVFVAGRAGIDRYLNRGIMIPIEKFRIVGRPQVSEILVQDTKTSDNSTKTVLYAPTWAGDAADTNYSSLDVGQKIVKHLIGRGYSVVLRAHPYTNRNPDTAAELRGCEYLLKVDAEANGRDHRWGSDVSELSFAECVNLSDIMICDVSSVATDWLYSEKPFVITDMRSEGESFSESFPLASAAYVVNSDVSNLSDVLIRISDGDDLFEYRKRMKHYYLGDFDPESYEDAFINAAREAYSEPKQTTYLGSSPVK